MGISTHGKLGGSILTRLGKNQKEGWKMKKGMSLVLALVMCLPLCACGPEKQTVEINYGEEHTIELKKQQEGIVWETENPDGWQSMDRPAIRFCI